MPVGRGTRSSPRIVSHIRCGRACQLMQCRTAPQAIKDHVAGWIANFQDSRFSIEQTLSEGHRVAMQLLMEGIPRLFYTLALRHK